MLKEIWDISCKKWSVENFNTGRNGLEVWQGKLLPWSCATHFLLYLLRVWVWCLCEQERLKKEGQRVANLCGQFIWVENPLFATLFCIYPIHISWLLWLGCLCRHAESVWNKVAVVDQLISTWLRVWTQERTRLQQVKGTIRQASRPRRAPKVIQCQVILKTTVGASFDCQPSWPNSKGTDHRIFYQ